MINQIQVFDFNFQTETKVFESGNNTINTKKTIFYIVYHFSRHSATLRRSIVKSPAAIWGLRAIGVLKTAIAVPKGKEIAIKDITKLIPREVIADFLIQKIGRLAHVDAVDRGFLTRSALYSTIKQIVETKFKKTMVEFLIHDRQQFDKVIKTLKQQIADEYSEERLYHQNYNLEKRHSRNPYHQAKLVEDLHNYEFFVKLWNQIYEFNEIVLPFTKTTPRIFKPLTGINKLPRLKECLQKFPFPAKASFEAQLTTILEHVLANGDFTKDEITALKTLFDATTITEMSKKNNWADAFKLI